MIFSGMTLPELLRQAAVAWEGNDMADVLMDAANRIEEPRKLVIVLQGSGPDTIFVECENAHGQSVAPDFGAPRPDGFREVVFSEIPE